MESSKVPGSYIAVGKWGKQSGGPQNEWSFELQKHHNLVKITVDHGELIYSLMFSTKSEGVLHTTNKFGGWNGGDTVTEVNFDDGEEIIGVNGTIGNKGSNIIISSLSFETNKRTHGPFGRPTETVFTLPWDKGSLVGFYGLAGYYIDAIGVYLKPCEETIRIGTWGKAQQVWSFQLEKNHLLKKITIDHGDLIYSLMFTTQCGDLTTEKFGGGNGGEIVSEVIFEGDEQITAINGTIALSGGNDAGSTVISSLSFTTNKKTHGPFGNVRGTPFTVPWDSGCFVGFTTRK